jgi:hypothetical protein
LRLQPEVANPEIDQPDLSKVKGKINNLRTELKTLDDRKVRLQLKFVDDKIPESDYLNLVRATNDEINLIKRQIVEQETIIRSSEKKKLTEKQKREIIRFAENIRKQWELMTDTEKKVFITTNIKRIYLYDDGIKSIEFY